MAFFLVRFMKVVLGEGREAEVCQRALKVEAENRESGLRIAKGLFCEAEKVAAWRIHADRIEISEDAKLPS